MALQRAQGTAERSVFESSQVTGSELFTTCFDLLVPKHLPFVPKFSKTLTSLTIKGSALHSDTRSSVPTQRLSSTGC